MKYETYFDESYSGSKYFNWRFCDEELQDEFETEIGYTSDYSIRLSDHKRPAVIDEFIVNEHRYFYDAPDEEAFKVAILYLKEVLNRYCNGEIVIQKLEDLLFNRHYDDMISWLKNEQLEEKIIENTMQISM